MSLRGVSISQGAIGINVAGDNREFGLILNGVNIADKLQYDRSYRLRRIQDAEAIGITPEYDQTHNIHVYRHIAEFYRIAGAGRVLNILIVDQQTAIKDMISSAKLLVVESDGNISDMAFASNLADDYLETTINGLSNVVYEAVPVLQEFANWCGDQDKPLHITLEGRAVSDTLSGLMDLRNFEITIEGEAVKLEANKVSMVIAQDYSHAKNFTGSSQKMADVGTFLGIIARAPWNRNPGEVQTGNIQNVPLNTWLIGGLSNHQRYSDVYESLETLNDKGYIIPVKYQGMTGYWFNDGPVCAPIVIDNQGNINAHTIYYSHTLDQCIRGLRLVYLPEIKKPVPLDNGKLPTDMIAYYNAIGDRFFGQLESAGLISQGQTMVDPDSDLLREKVLRVQFSVIPTGTISEIIGTINLKTNF